MSSHARTTLVLSLLFLSWAAAPGASAQRRGGHRAVVSGGVVFVGGYFYDPFFGPYPWWQQPAYPYPYYPIYDNRGEVRLLVTPEEASVYVDGFYGGIVDDFNGFFQRLPLPPGGHDVVLYLEGFRTVHRHLYLTPGGTLEVELAMARLPEGETSEPPAAAVPLPPPPAGTYRTPRTPSSWPVPRSSVTAGTAACGTLSLRVQPPHASVTIDGEPWTSSDGEHFVIEVEVGEHRVDVSRPGFSGFWIDLQVREGETTPLNVSLSPAKP